MPGRCTIKECAYRYNRMGDAARMGYVLQYARASARASGVIYEHAF